LTLARAAFGSDRRSDYVASFIVEKPYVSLLFNKMNSTDIFFKKREDIGPTYTIKHTRTQSVFSSECGHWLKTVKQRPSLFETSRLDIDFEVHGIIMSITHVRHKIACYKTFDAA